MGAVRLWSVEHPRLGRLLYSHSAAAHIGLGPDEGLIVVQRSGGAPLLLDVATGKQRPSVLDSLPDCFVKFAPDSRTFAAHIANPHWGDLEVREWPTGNLRLSSQGRGFDGIAYSRDGKILAAAGRDGMITFWNTENWEERDTILGHTQAITSLAFARDGKTLAGGCADGVVKLWNVATGRELMMLEAHTDTCSSIQFSPNGTIFMSSGTTKVPEARHEVLLWRTQSEPVDGP
jgi:WD40 repeat protein